jgi:D-aminopeptidase
LVERVENLQAHEDERCVHQIKAKMHEGLKAKYFLRPARISPDVMNQTQYALRRRSARRTLRRQDELVVGYWKQKASAAAEVMPLSRTSS